MAGFGIGDLLQSLQQAVQALQTINTTINNRFFQVTASSTKAPTTTGTITFTSSEASFFLLVQTSSGFTGKVPIYPQ
jgi:hypothetical protein